jgi:hypothetical protein
MGRAAPDGDGNENQPEITLRYRYGA